MFLYIPVTICLKYLFLHVLYRYTHFYTAANVHSAIKQFLQIIHTSLAIEILS